MMTFQIAKIYSLQPNDEHDGFQQDFCAPCSYYNDAVVNDGYYEADADCGYSDDAYNEEWA